MRWLVLTAVAAALLWLLWSQASSSGESSPGHDDAIPGPQGEQQERQVEEGAERVPSTTHPASLLPALFDGIHLGSRLDDVRARRAIEAPERTDLGLVYTETLTDGRGVYVFRNERLALVQHLRQSTPETASELLRETMVRLGSPDSTWTCAGETGAPLPTQRLVWRHESVAAQEILLVHPTGVSVTFVAGSDHDISQSLERSNCGPMSSPNDLANPATAAQLRNAAEAQTAGSASR